MGLFSKFGKNKQESTGEDSGYYRAADDQSVLEKTARSKRASHAGGATRGSRSGRAGRDAADPVLPEKKRARRRLVGAIALALAVVIGLPMVLDSEPRPVANDIAIQIPSKDKPAEQGASAPAASASESRVAPGAALDQSEEIVNEPARDAGQPAARDAATPAAAALAGKPAATPAAAVTAPNASAAKPATTPTATAAHTVSELKLADPVKPPKAEVKEAPKAADSKTAKADKPEARDAKRDARAEAKPESRSEAKHAEARPEPKESKDAKPAHGGEDARALAILEGKPAAAESSSKYVIQVAALAAQDKVDELQSKLSAAGIKSYSQKVNTASGERTRVRVGPFANKEEAEKVRAKLSKMGLNGSLVPV